MYGNLWLRLWGEVSDDFQNEILQREDESSVMALDCAWAHRKFRSHAGELVIMDWATHKPIMVITMQKQRYLLQKLIVEANFGYGGTAKGMEGFAVGIGLDQLQSKGLLAKFWARVNDDDASTSKRFAERDFCAHIQMFLDPGHKKKNVLKTLKGILGNKTKFNKLAGRMSSFFLRCIKEACMAYPDDTERARLHFLWLFSFWVPHYTKGECEADCPCHHAHMGDVDAETAGEKGNSGDAGATARNKRACLDPTTDALEIAELEKFHANLASEVQEYVSGYGTTHLESHNAASKALAPKRIHYYKSWGARTLVAAIKSHIGDGILVRLCEKLHIPIQEPALQEIGTMVDHAKNEADHKATKAYKKMKAKGRKISRGVRELEVLWSAKHGNDGYDGEKVIDYNGLALATTLELGLGAVIRTAKKKTYEAGESKHCDLCNSTMKASSYKGHLKSQKHIRLTAKAAAAQTSSAPPTVPATVPATAAMTSPAPARPRAPSPAPAPASTPPSVAVGSAHDEAMETGRFLAAMELLHASRLVSLSSLQASVTEEMAAQAYDEETNNDT
jgi:hypothetical protein